MKMEVFIEPHERAEALEAYRQWLRPDQEQEIEDAPESAVVCLSRTNWQTTITVIEEG